MPEGAGGYTPRRSHPGRPGGNRIRDRQTGRVIAGRAAPAVRLRHSNGVTVTGLLAILAGGFGVGMGASPLLQALRVRRRRSSADVSVSFLFVLFAGGLAWLSYGIALPNAALIVGNSVGVMCSTTAILLTLRFRKTTGGAAGEGFDDPPRGKLEGASP